MESVIREGVLRLQTEETSCDVIINCQGHRLMAHKLMLSIASPILENILKENSTAPSVIILPDVSSSIMSLILDYIYTGSVVVYSNTLQEFLSVVNLLKIHLDKDCLDKCAGKSPCSDSSDDVKPYKPEDFIKKKEEVIKEQTEMLDIESPNSPEGYCRKNMRKVPNFPINKRREKARKLCNYVIPSPWCQRGETVLADPRNDYLGLPENQISPRIRDKIEENDTNNNFQITGVPRYFPSHIASAFPLYPRELSEPSKEFDLSINRNNPSLEQRILPQCKKPTLNYTPSKPELTKIDKIASKLEKQKILEFSSSLSQERNSVKDSLSSSSGSSNEDDEKNSGTCENTKLKQERQKTFKCEDCGKCFSQLRNYKYHRSVHEGTKEFAAKCSECGKVFNDRGYLSSHMKIHRDRKEYACPHCPKRFNQRVAYNMHLRIHTGVKPHECPTCGKSFSRKMLLKQHQRVHTGERPYSCPECGKTFADRSNMSLHARLHTGVKPYACNLCPKSFTKKHHLKTHMNFHTGLKPYTCQKCGLAFSQSSNMRTHYKKCILKNLSESSSSQPSAQEEKQSAS